MNTYTWAIFHAMSIPFTAIFMHLGFIYVHKQLDLVQISAITGICLGLIWAVFISNDSESQEVCPNLLYTCICAVLQAAKITMENRLFAIDWNLEAHTLYRATCVWNLIMLFDLFLVSTLFSGPLGEATGSNLSAILAAWQNYKAANVLVVAKVILFVAVGHAVTFLSLVLTRNYNAVFM